VQKYSETKREVATSSEHVNTVTKSVIPDLFSALLHPVSTRQDQLCSVLPYMFPFTPVTFVTTLKKEIE